MRFSHAQLSLFLFIAASFWGVYWVPLRLLEGQGIHDAFGVAYFNAAPGLIILPLVLILGGQMRGHLAPILIVAICAGLGLAFYACGLVISTVVRTTLLFYLTPIWSTIIAAIWLGERITYARMFALGLGLLGMVLLLSNGTSWSSVSLTGDVLGVLSGIFWGISTNALKRWPHTPIVLTSSLQFLVTAIVGLVLAIWVFENEIPSTQAMMDGLPIALGIGLCFLFPSILVIFWVSRQLSPGRVGLLMMSEVIVAIISAAIFLPEETMSTLQWAGGLLILSACFWEVVFDNQAAAAVQD